MSEIPKPTDEDFARDLAADLATCQEVERLQAVVDAGNFPAYPGQPGWREKAALGRAVGAFNAVSFRGWPAAVRRAAAAEARARELIRRAVRVFGARLKVREDHMRELYAVLSGHDPYYRDKVVPPITDDEVRAHLKESP
jgi:hypothetical protein